MVPHSITIRNIEAFVGDVESKRCRKLTGHYAPEGV